MTGQISDLDSVFDFIAPDRLFPFVGMSASRVRAAIEPYVKRRLKEDVLDELPPKFSNYVTLDLTTSQRESYDRAEQEGVVQLRNMEEITLQHVLALITRLKQICNFDPATSASCKMDYLADTLPTMLEEERDDKALVFSQYVKTLEEIESNLTAYNPLVYTGQLSGAQREAMEVEFNDDDNKRIMLLSVQAGGTGLNLQRANYVIHFDKWWNPALAEQAEGRAHRINQKSPVFVTHLVCEDTIEQRIESILERKRVLFGEVFDDLTDDDLSSVITPAEFFQLFDLEAPERYTRGSSTDEEGAEDEVVKPVEEFDASVATVEVPQDVEAFEILRETERELRALITSSLKGPGKWWRSGWPAQSWQGAEARVQKDIEMGRITSIADADPCDYLNWGDYVQIIERSDNWDEHFAGVFGTKDSFRVYMGHLIATRNSVFPSRDLADEEREDLKTFSRLIIRAIHRATVSIGAT